MNIARAGGRLLVAAACLAGMTAAFAVEPGERMGAVLAARLDLQQRLGEMVTTAVTAPAAPYKVLATVQLAMRGEVREVVARDDAPDSVMQIGASRAMKLPGLGVVDKPLQGVAAPDISVKIPGRRSSAVARSLETEVAKMAVHLFIDPRMPPDRRDVVKKIAGDAVGIDPGHGDSIEITELPTAAVPADLPVAAVVTRGEGGFPWELVAICATVLLATGILAAAIGRKSGGGGGHVSIETGGGKGGGDAADGDAAEEGEGALAGLAPRAGHSGLHAFETLAEATPDELADLLGEVDPTVGAAVLDQVGLDAKTAKCVFERLPRERQLDIGLALGAGRVMARATLADMETVVQGALARIRNRVTLGGPSRLAEFLAQAPESAQRDMLDGIAQRNPSLAMALRGELVLFEDLGGLDDATIRQVVTGVDPATVALALVGAAEEIREAVLRSVSKRLKGILTVEQETMAERPAAEIEAARKTLEQSMRRIQLRGELKGRAA